MSLKTRKLTALALLATVAMILSYVESMIPPFVAIPGIKVGLANIAVVFALYRFGGKEALAISLVRVFAVALLFGTGVSLLYSAAGALMSLLFMLLLRRLGVFSSVGVSVAGGVVHNLAQIAVASIILETNVLKYYLPYLILSGTVAGIAIGLLTAIAVKRVKWSL